MRIQLESVVEDLWGQFTNALKNYQESTEERKKAYEDLKARDERSAEEIDMQMRKLQRISVSSLYYQVLGLVRVFSVLVNFLARSLIIYKSSVKNAKAQKIKGLKLLLFDYCK